ncbi:IS3 family transposase [Zunongwangia endophytica]|uniref:IS3 family transposase n=1 Tax=Zunongwangia endophytica TaxID=1808945 RepID=UPI0025B482BB|nr:IS3 family transposase [Zunongwangia endophytica]MDN3594205.1 IS3 family transposase [Zunongwangia endophytica]
MIQCFGISKQAFYKRLRSQKTRQVQQQLIIRLIKEYRSKYGMRTGGIKLYKELKNDMNRLGIKIGRDKFYRVMRINNLLVPKTKRFHITTDSKHRFFKYRNMIKNKVPSRPEQLWVSDITYIKTQSGHSYLALVTDAYSKQIMGYKLASHMKTSLCIDALKMALKNRKYKNQKLIHHSDRGIQYCNPLYTGFAEQEGILMSMTEKYDPYENAIAERINRTLKYEYDLKRTIKNTKLAKKIVKRAVEIYNNKRPHFSLKLNTPNFVHLNKNVDYHSYKKNKQNLEVLTI